MFNINRFSTITFAFFFLLFSVTLNVLAAPHFEEKDLSEVGWSVSLTDVIHDPVTNSTSFVYALDAENGEKDLSHWVLSVDIDNVNIVSIFPDNEISYGLDPTTGAMGIKWDSGQDAGTSAQYIVTVSGQVQVVEVNYAVKGGTYYAVGTTQGPGDKVITDNVTYSISGTVYVDADANFALGSGEPLLENVTVELYNSEGALVANALTDVLGHYMFNDLLPGDYSAVIPDSTFVSDFNESLGAYFIAAMGKSINSTIINGDLANQDFGFLVDGRALLDDLNTADPDGDGFSFPGEGRTIGFWKHQLAVAMSGKGRAQVNAVTMMSYIVAIESYLLVEPFQFTDGIEFSDAHTIMAMRTSNAVELLEKQLLGAEFSHMAGLGLGGSYFALQHIILGWSEYLAANHTEFTREDLLLAKDILDYINNMGH